MKITLLRHGEPEFKLSGKVKACDLGAIAKAYDVTGIVGNAPDDAVVLSKEHNVVVCSSLPRSLQSAEALGVVDVHLASSLFNETSVPYFTAGSLTLPIGVWVFILRILWYFGFSRNGESLAATKERAKQAAHKLLKLAAEFESVLLVGHGFINYFIAKELLANNWQGPSNSGRNYWAFGVYRYTAEKLIN